MTKEISRGLARDEDGILCRFCCPALGTIRALLSCRCVAACGHPECTGARLVPHPAASTRDHNHVTRDIKPEDKCPGCDRYHASRKAQGEG